MRIYPVFCAEHAGGLVPQGNARGGGVFLGRRRGEQDGKDKKQGKQRNGTSLHDKVLPRPDIKREGQTMRRDSCEKGIVFSF